MGRDFVDLKDGDTLEPYHINQIYKELRRWRKLKVSGQAVLSHVEDGESPPLLVVNRGTIGYFGTANGTISPRVNSTAGSGTVSIMWIDTTANSNSIAAAQVSDIPVYNVSANTMTSGNGIDSGQYVWVQRDLFGNWIVSPLECS